MKGTSLITIQIHGTTYRLDRDKKFGILGVSRALSNLSRMGLQDEAQRVRSFGISMAELENDLVKALENQDYNLLEDVAYKLLNIDFYRGQQASPLFVQLNLDHEVFDGFDDEHLELIQEVFTQIMISMTIEAENISDLCSLWIDIVTGGNSSDLDIFSARFGVLKTTYVEESISGW